MNPRIQNNFYVEPFKNVRMKQMNYNGFIIPSSRHHIAFLRALRDGGFQESEHQTIR